jgi:hypothetical protein
VRLPLIAVSHFLVIPAQAGIYPSYRHRPPPV